MSGEPRCKAPCGAEGSERGIRLRVVTKHAQRNWLVGYRLKQLIVGG